MIIALSQNPYYTEMLHKNRMFLFAIKQRDGLMGFITFYIGNQEDENKFVRENMWSVLEDNPEGDVCWIDQLITNKAEVNAKLSYKIWNGLKNYIQSNFPSVKLIRWNRAKINRLTGIREIKTYKKEMEKCQN